MDFSELIKNLHQTFIVEDRYVSILEGIKNTFIITLSAVVIGAIIGILLAIFKVLSNKITIKSSHGTGKIGAVLIKILSIFANIYTTVFRGIPVIIQLLIINFGVFVGPLAGVSPLIAAIIGFGLNSAAYVCESVRAGIEAVDYGQYESGRSLGFTYIKTMFLIILPQAIKNILPALGNEFIALFKETSVAGWISVIDITKAFDSIRAVSYNPFPLYVSAIVYLLCVMVFTFIFSAIERRLRKSDRS